MPTRLAKGSCDKKGAWSPEEDDLLTELIDLHGAHNWSVIASGIQGRSGKSCRLRWCNQLNPDIKKEPFSDWEDAVIVKSHEEYGNRWAEISKFLLGRTDNSIKNRYLQSKCDLHWLLGNRDCEPPERMAVSDIPSPRKRRRTMSARVPSRHLTACTTPPSKRRCMPDEPLPCSPVQEACPSSPGEDCAEEVAKPSSSDNSSTTQICAATPSPALPAPVEATVPPPASPSDGTATSLPCVMLVRAASAEEEVLIEATSLRRTASLAQPQLLASLLSRASSLSSSLECMWSEGVLPELASGRPLHLATQESCPSSAAATDMGMEDAGVGGIGFAGECACEGDDWNMFGRHQPARGAALLERATSDVANLVAMYLSDCGGSMLQGF